MERSAQAQSYLANLAAAGCTPEDIDIVMCTHLHADHLGWNTRLQSGRWVPTFPNARYVMTQREIDQRAQDAAQSPQANHGSYQDSVLPVLDAGLAKVARPGDEIAEGITIIDLAGHSPGQIGLDLAADAESQLLFCGDAIHSPVQVFHPKWSSNFCFDRAQAVDTRRMLLQRAVTEDFDCCCRALAGSQHARRRGKERRLCASHRGLAEKRHATCSESRSDWIIDVRIT